MDLESVVEMLKLIQPDSSKNFVEIPAFVDFCRNVKKAK